MLDSLRGSSINIGTIQRRLASQVHIRELPDPAGARPPDHDAGGGQLGRGATTTHYIILTNVLYYMISSSIV